MQKTIRVDQLRLGMHLHSLSGAWLEHPFWKTRFVLQDPSDLARVRASGIKECVIDTAFGLDVEPALAVAPSPVPTPTPAAAAQPAPQRNSLEQEAAIATRLCAQARHSVTALFDDARMGRALDVEGCVPLVDEIAASMRRNASAMLGLVHKV